MRLQREEERLHLLGLGLPQRRQDQRNAIRANLGAESARHGGYDKEFKEVIDARVIASQKHKSCKTQHSFPRQERRAEIEELCASHEGNS